jgi:hypothetical protein
MLYDCAHSTPNLTVSWVLCPTCSDLQAVIPHFVFETGSLYVAQAGLELKISLPQPP